MAETLTLAHISDLHLTTLDGFGLRHWNLKRGLGFLNWHRSRKRVHRADVLHALCLDLQAQTPDHIAVTGDLVNIGLPREYEVALEWLRQLGLPDRVSVVPGNHDIYVRLSSDPGVERWRPYMRPDDWGEKLLAPVDNGFPFVRRLGGTALVGVNSSEPTRPFVAAGRVGSRQLRALGKALDRLLDEGLVRVVLIHHPPLPGQAPLRRGLRDAAELRAVLEGHGAELVLHGHNHSDTLVWCKSRTGLIPVVGIASGSAARTHREEPLARYNIFRIRATDHDWSIDWITRGLADPLGPIVELQRRSLTPDPAVIAGLH